MMFKKFLRTVWNYKAQFVSMILMITIGAGAYFGFNISWYSIDRNLEKYIETSGYADYRLYRSEAFSKEDIEAVKNITGVQNASRVLSEKLNIKASDNILSVFCLEDYEVSRMTVTKGAQYDENKKGMWLSDEFAEKNNIRVGDVIEVSYLGFNIDCEVLGLAKSMEYLVCISDENQLMPNYEKYGFAYISPAKLYEELETEYYPQINIISDLSKDELEDKLRSVLGENIYVTSMEEHVSYRGAINEISDGKILGTVLPIFFLIIAILTMITTMHRITDKERLHIGTLKSMGFTDHEVFKHYMLYGLVSGVLGCICGWAFGFALTRIILTDKGLLSKYLDFPSWELHIPARCFVVCIIIVLLQVLVCYLSLKRMLKGTVAGIFRNSVNKNSIKVAKIEKSRLWKHFSFTIKWNIRDALTHKLRLLMSFIGVLGCTIMLITAFGLKSSTKELIEFIDEDVYNFETRINMASMVNNKRITEFADKYDGDWSAKTYSLVNGENTNIYIYEISHDTVRFVDDKNNAVALKDTGVYVSTNFKSDIEVGEYIKIKPYDSEKSYKVKVQGFIRPVIGKSITMTAKFAESIGYEYDISSVYTNLPQEDIEKEKIVLDVLEKEGIISSYKSFIGILNIMIGILGVCAVLLGMVVLYNLGMMGYIERSRELATLKVIGYKDKEITRILVTQNLWTTVFGIIPGLPLGRKMLEILLSLLSTEYEMKTVISAKDYVLAILITAVVSVLITGFVANKNRYIDMAGAMKDNE